MVWTVRLPAESQTSVLRVTNPLVSANLGCSSSAWKELSSLRSVAADFQVAPSS